MVETVGALQSDWVRRANRLSVYHNLLRGTEVTRAEIARDTGLSVPTVATILGEFSGLELIDVAGEARPRGGRPAQLVKLNARARYVLGLDLSGEYARAAFVGLSGQRYPLSDGPRLEPNVEAALGNWLAGLFAGFAERKRIARLAVSVPGVVDQASGHVRLAPGLGWSDYALAEVFSVIGGVKVMLENDVNALALAERAHVAPGTFKHILFVRIDKGIGASLFVGEDLYRGAGSAAGEIGYSLLPQLNGPLELGASGPLETHLLGLSRAFLGSGGLLETGTSSAERAFVQFADTFGLVLHNLTCLLNPERVVVSWPADPEARLVSYLQRAWSGPFEVHFQASQLDDRAAIHGAAQIALDDLAQTFCHSPSLERLL